MRNIPIGDKRPKKDILGMEKGVRGILYLSTVPVTLETIRRGAFEPQHLHKIIHTKVGVGIIFANFTICAPLYHIEEVCPST